MPADSAVAGYIHADESATRSALGLLNLPRRFVVFGDSWTTTLDGVNIPQTAIQHARRSRTGRRNSYCARHTAQAHDAQEVDLIEGVMPGPWEL